MATSIALALATAAITACGGGGGSDTQASVADTPTGTTVASTGSTDASSVTEQPVTTNANAVAVAAGDTTSSTDTAAASTDTTTTVADATTTVADATTTAADAATGAASTSSAGDTQVEALAAGPVVASAIVARPAGNTGTGFYVVGSKLYDANGKEFRIRGVNRVHYDNGAPGLPLSGANTERIVLNFTKTPASNFAVLKNEMLNQKIVPMPGNWDGTCSADPAKLSGIVDTWVAQAATWKQLNSNGLINIANEWGPDGSTVWRDGYVAAIPRMRAAGYTGTLVVDAGACGQSAADIVKYGAAVMAADPQKNILFSVHVYGAFHYPATASWMQDYTKAFAQLKASGLPLIIGEFGPGHNIGPSPTMVTPAKVIADAEANGWGWLPWGWDDNNLTGCLANDGWFSMTVKCGKYATTSDLTTFGKTVVPILQATAVKSGIFN